MSEERIAALEAELAKERQEKIEAHERADRAVMRAGDAEEACRRVQLDAVTARDEVQALRAEMGAMMRMLVALETERDDLKKSLEAMRPQTPSTPPRSDIVEQMLRRMTSLRETLASTASELSQLHADEVELAARRTRVLGDACAVLSRAVGESGQAPPPLPLVVASPSAALEARLSMRPVVDISEVAELIHSLRPPPPKDE
jgi:hypothetical protein